MQTWQDWSSWLREGYFISYLRDGVRYYEYIVQRDFGHWEYVWPATITAEEVSGPYTPSTLEITRGYDEQTNTNRLWQLIFQRQGALRPGQLPCHQAVSILLRHRPLLRVCERLWEASRG